MVQPANPTPAAPAAALADALWAAEMLPILELRAADAARLLSADAADVLAINNWIGALRRAVDGARMAGELPENIGRLIANATPEVTARWVGFAREQAALERAAALTANVQTRAARWRRVILFAAYPILSGANGRAGDRLTADDYLPLVHQVLDPQQESASTASLILLDRYIEELLVDGGEVTLDALARRHAYTALAGEATDAIDAVAQAAVAATGIRGLAAAERRLEVRSLISQLQGRDHTFGFGGATNMDARAIALADLVSMVDRRYRWQHKGAAPAGPVTMADLETLVSDKLGPRAPFTWASLLRVRENALARDRWLAHHRAAWVVRTVVRQPTLRRGLERTSFYRSVADWQVRRVQKMPAGPGQSAMPDSAALITAERDQIWSALPDDGSTTLADVDHLVRARREFYAHNRNRLFTGLSDYRPMMLELLGTAGPVTGQVLADLALLVRQAHDASASGLRLLTRPRLPVILADLVTAGWNEGKAGPRPTPPGADPRHSKLVSAFHAIGALPFTDELTWWLNGIIPLSAGGVQEPTVRRKIVSLFAQVLDEGADITVTAGGRTYDIRLWAVPTAPPRVRPSSLLAAGQPGGGRYSGKGENRIYSYTDTAVSRAAVSGGYADLGPAIRLEKGVARTDLAGPSAIQGCPGHAASAA